MRGAVPDHQPNVLANALERVAELERSVAALSAGDYLVFKTDKRPVQFLAHRFAFRIRGVVRDLADLMQVAKRVCLLQGRRHDQALDETVGDAEAPGLILNDGLLAGHGGLKPLGERERGHGPAPLGETSHHDGESRASAALVGGLAYRRDARALDDLYLPSRGSRLIDLGGLDEAALRLSPGPRRGAISGRRIVGMAVIGAAVAHGLTALGMMALGAGGRTRASAREDLQ